MADIDEMIAKLEPPWDALFPHNQLSVPLIVLRLTKEALAAAGLDAPGKTYADGDKAPGHLAAAGLVFAVANYVWAKFPTPERDQVLEASSELLSQLGVPDNDDVAGWRQN